MISVDRLTTFSRRTVLTLALVTTSAAPVLAGPPMICHPFDIGTAKSLPFGPLTQGWKTLDPSYDRSRLIDDTLSLLAPQTPVLVRMETMRRATAYVADDRALAERLLRAVQARVVTKSPTTPAEILAVFDAGYLTETYRQLGGHGAGLDAVAGTTDGYAMVKTALAARPDDAAMHFAAALITRTPTSRSEYLAHAEKARAMAKADTLVARNVATHLAN